MTTCQNRWRRAGVAKQCGLPAIGRYLVMADSQYPNPGPAVRVGLGKAFVELELCRPCAKHLGVMRANEPAAV